MTLKKEEFFTVDDLYCGNSIPIYGKLCVIYDCDQFTRAWYRANRGIE